MLLIGLYCDGDLGQWEVERLVSECIAADRFGAGWGDPVKGSLFHAEIGVDVCLGQFVTEPASSSVALQFLDL